MLNSSAGYSLNLAEYKSAVAPISNKNLAVVQASPQGQIKAGASRAEVVVVFNHPIKELAILEDNVAGVFSLTPKIKGKFRWYGSRVCSFIPLEPYQPGTKYTIKVKANTKSLKGHSLDKNYKFSFHTEPLKLKFISPYSRKVTIDYEQSFRFHFNYPVPVKNSKKYFSLFNNGKKIPFKLQYALSNKKPLKDILLVIPAKKYKRDSKVQVLLKSGLKPIQGNLGLKKDVVHSYTTYGPLRAYYISRNRFYQNFNGHLEFNNPVDLQKASQAIRIKPKVKLRYKPTGRGRYLYLENWQIRPGQDYELSVPESFSDLYGNAMEGKKVFDIKIPGYRRDFFTEQGMYFIESHEQQLVGINLYAMESLSVETAYFDLDDLLDYIDADSYQENLKYDTEDIIPWFTNLTENQSGFRPYNLKSAFAKNNWLAVTFHGIAQDYKGRNRAKKYIQYLQNTNIGIIAKAAYDKADVYLHSFDSNDGLENRTVTAYNGDSAIGKCTSNSHGYCRIEYENPYVKSVRKLLFVAGEEDEKVFVSQRNHSLSMWAVSNNFSSRAHLPTLVGQILFDRKLYRPGEKVFFKAVAAIRKNGKILTKSSLLQDIEVRISNSRGKQVYKKEKDASKQGGIWGSFTIAADAPLGHYTISLKTSRLKNDLSFYDTFQVEEFKPVSFKVESSGIKNALLEETLNVTLSAAYMYGAPMQKARFSYKVNRRVRNMYFDHLGSYNFGDYDYGLSWHSNNWQYYMSKSGNLNKSGKFKLKIPLTALPAIELKEFPVSRIYDLEFEAKVKDVNDKTITHRKSATIYPGKTLLGIKAKDLYLNLQQAFEFDLLVVSNKGRALKTTKDIILLIHKKEYKSIQTKGPGGSLQKKNTLIRVKVLQKNLKLGSSPTKYFYKAKDSGSYTLTLVSPGSKSYSRIEFYAFGGGYDPWNFHDDDSVTVQSDKTSYKVGDTAKIIIASPFKKCKAIISIERESIYEQRQVELQGNGSPIEIKIRKEYLPTVYVSAVLISPRVAVAKEKLSKNDLGRPQLMVGSVQLQINTKQKVLPLKIKTNKIFYGPGDSVVLFVNSAANAEIAISIADRGVLDLINYRYKDPVHTFYKNWPSGVRILENRRALLKQLSYANKGKAPGGKGMEEVGAVGKGGFGHDAEDGIRKDFRYTAFWNPNVKTDEYGLAM